MWNLGRVIFLCALFPTGLFLVGVCKRVIATLRRVFGGAQGPPAPLGDWLLDLTAFGHLAFIMLYALQYRDYSFMKAIFIFPGLFAFLVLFARECDHFYAGCGQRRAVRLAADAIFVCLLLLYAGGRDRFNCTDRGREAPPFLTLLPVTRRDLTGSPPRAPRRTGLRAARSGDGGRSAPVRAARRRRSAGSRVPRQ